VEKLKRLRETRDGSKANTSLETIRQRAIANENLMPSVIEAVENYCTLGEIADVLRGVFGEYK
jgi:methylmalonyl-CoA mutase N-terminal domain/subunit